MTTNYIQNLPTDQRLHRKLFVISAVNFSEGGPLKILRDCIGSAEQTLPENWDILAFVHSKELLNTTRCELIELPAAKTSWFKRLYLEWFGFHKYSKALQPSMWLSLHDITPFVGKTRQAVYCHNPTPFFRMRFRDVILQPVLLLFRVAYSWLYRIGISRNAFVIVQQSWLRDEFRRWTDKPKIIVAPPVQIEGHTHAYKVRKSKTSAIFFYPALPRVFKNFELLCHACAILASNEHWKSRVVITIDGTENKYSKWIRKKYGHIDCIDFVGPQDSGGMDKWYSESDCLIFPSRLETWGLPITEAKAYGLPMLVSDLPYAHETVGVYDSVEFINVDDAHALAKVLLEFQDSKITFRKINRVEVSQPCTRNWNELLEKLIQ